MTIPKTCRSFTISIASDALAVRDALGEVTRRLAQLGLATDDIATVELVTAEVLNNIVEHAYSDEPGNIIRLCCNQKSDGLHITFEDIGKRMPEGDAPNATSANADAEFDDLPEGGFGWFLIHELTSDLTYRRQRDRNLLSMCLPTPHTVRRE
ncbi:MAG: ATP-binding protein [Paracoccaceae bacterium]